MRSSQCFEGEPVSAERWLSVKYKELPARNVSGLLSGSTEMAKISNKLFNRGIY